MFPCDLSPVLTYSGRSRPGYIYLAASSVQKHEDQHPNLRSLRASREGREQPRTSHRAVRATQKETRKPIPSTKEHSGPTTFSRNIVASMNIRLWGVTETDRGRGDEALMSAPAPASLPPSTFLPVPAASQGFELLSCTPGCDRGFGNSQALGMCSKPPRAQQPPRHMTHG